jgi:aspartate kinase
VSKNHEHSTQIVVKYGGSSLADHERISKAATTVAKEYKKGTRIAVVVSAMGKTTDLLLDLVNNSCGGNVDKVQLDDILAMGERTSARVFAATLKAKGVQTRYFDPSDEDWPIVTDDVFSNANPVLEQCEERIRRHILPLVEENIVPIIPGFVGKTSDGRITTLGRGGSDTTAFILAKALKTNEVVLVTDSDGIMSADPKLINNPRVLAEIDVNALMEMADSSAKFIHRKALKYKDPSVNVRVINHRSGELSANGTIIVGAYSNGFDVTVASPSPAASITVVGRSISENPTIINELTEKVKTYSSLLGLSADSNSLILYVSEEGDLDSLFKRINETLIDHDKVVAISVRRKLALIKATGIGLEETRGIIGKISESLQANDVNVFGILTAGSSILLFVEWSEREKVLTSVKHSLGR